MKRLLLTGVKQGAKLLRFKSFGRLFGRFVPGLNIIFNGLFLYETARWLVPKLFGKGFTGYESQLPEIKVGHIVILFGVCLYIFVLPYAKSMMIGWLAIACVFGGYGLTKTRFEFAKANDDLQQIEYKYEDAIEVATKEAKEEQKGVEAVPISKEDKRKIPNPNPTGSNALHEAISKQQHVVVTEMLKVVSKDAINRHDEDSMTPICVALKSGDYKMIQLVASNPNVDFRKRCKWQEWDFWRDFHTGLIWYKPVDFAITYADEDAVYLTLKMEQKQYGSVDTGLIDRSSQEAVKRIVSERDKDHHIKLN